MAAWCVVTSANEIELTTTRFVSLSVTLSAQLAKTMSANAGVTRMCPPPFGGAYAHGCLHPNSLTKGSRPFRIGFGGLRHEPFVDSHSTVSQLTLDPCLLARLRQRSLHP